MADRRESKSRDHYKQSVVLQRAESNDVTNPQVLRRRSLTIAHLYLSSASLARTRTRHLSQNGIVQTSEDTDSGTEKVLDSVGERPKSAYPFERPKTEYSCDMPEQAVPVERSKREYQKPEEHFQTVRPRPRVTLGRPKSEHFSRRPVLEYRNVVLRDSDQKRVVPRLSKSERGQPDGSHDTDMSNFGSRLNSSMQRKS